MLYCGNLYGTVVKVEMLKGGAEILVRIAPLCATTEDITSHILCIPFVHAIVHKYGPQRLLLLAYDARVDMAHTIHINENIPTYFLVLQLPQKPDTDARPSPTIKLCRSRHATTPAINIPNRSQTRSRRS